MVPNFHNFLRTTFPESSSRNALVKFQIRNVSPAAIEAFYGFVVRGFSQWKLFQYRPRGTIELEFFIVSKQLWIPCPLLPLWVVPGVFTAFVDLLLHCGLGNSMAGIFILQPTV